MQRANHPTRTTAKLSQRDTDEPTPNTVFNWWFIISQRITKESFIRITHDPNIFIIVSMIITWFSLPLLLLRLIQTFVYTIGWAPKAKGHILPYIDTFPVFALWLCSFLYYIIFAAAIHDKLVLNALAILIQNPCFVRRSHQSSGGW